MANTVPGSEDRTASIADQLNRLRKEASISVEALSTTTGIPKRTLDRKLTTNPASLTTGELIRISDALGVNLSEIFEGAA